ncbi:uncharacterized protein [Montipora capricornis]|uniref:uncharacterized protein isoform X3 n=1 Tax=Montipora capricornis TaxID=246305 RepID=UPI0035F1213B
MLQYHGRPGDLNAKSANSGSSNAHRRGTFALIPPEREKQARPSSESTCQLTRAKTRFRREEKIRINVSGKRYHLTQTQLQRFPESLLADPAKRVYYCEEVDDRTVFRSIPDACWWAVVTITTLGYGDMIPTTFAGKLVGGICCLSGVFLITPLLPIIYNKFDRFQRLEQNKTKARYHYRPSIKVKGSPLVEERVQEFAPVETGQRQE